MSFDVERIRSDFPILSRELPGGKRLAYLDNGATSQKPRPVIERITRFFEEENANIHRGLHHLSAEATTHFEQARESISHALNLPAGSDLIFTRGTTESINLAAHGLEARLGDGDEIIITLMEHHANFVPWQILAEKTGAKLKFAEVKDNGELDLEHWKSCFSPAAKVAAFAGVSNALGTIHPAVEMCRFCRERGVVSLVDGAQKLPHGPADLAELDCDFFAFSGHKMFGPDGIGVLAGRSELLNQFPPYQSGGDMIETVAVEGSVFRESPDRFEAGTPHISGAIALAAAFDYLAGLDWPAVAKHEEDLLNETRNRLDDFGGVTIWGNAAQQAPIVSFTMEEAHPQDVATVLDQVGVAVRTGHHCAQPLMTRLGITGTVRASFALYNNREDIEALLAGLHKVRQLFS